METLEIVLLALLVVSSVLAVAIRLFRLVPITRLTEAVAEGGRTLSVRSPRGFEPGQHVYLTRRRRRELLTVVKVTEDGQLVVTEGVVHACPRGARVAAASGFLETVDTFFVALSMAFLIRLFLVQAFKIPSGSMKDTLQIGDHLLVAKFLYGTKIPLTQRLIWRLRAPRRGEIIVFQYPGENPADTHHGTDFIKRCVGVEGDVLEMRDKVLYVNHVAREEAYTRISQPRSRPRFERGEDCNYIARTDPEHVGPSAFPGSSRDNWGPYRVPEGHLFMMGDNRDESFDARCWGPLPLHRIRGKALLIYYPPTRWRLIRTSSPASQAAGARLRG